ncbi:MAG: GPR endopeptidase [Bacillota bacterium]|nr:GPR endopeptidase [Bacillota bacterium]
MQFRTDLAIEEKESLGDEIQGVDLKSEEVSGMEITRLEIKSDEAARSLHKEKGMYITIDLPPLTDNFKDTDERLLNIADEIRRLLPKDGLILIAGLGNSNITPDALGPKTASGVLATRHITGELARATGLDQLRPVAVFSTGVTGQTGIETGELISGIIGKIKPTAIVVIDALASRKLSRLGCTLQISNTGISPGAGVGNHRTKITQETMGVPVISMGVPTVVDAATLAADLLVPDDERASEAIREEVSPDGRMMVVTPREIDLLIERSAKLIGMSVNCALHPDFSISDLLSLVK